MTQTTYPLLYVRFKDADLAKVSGCSIENTYLVLFIDHETSPVCFLIANDVDEFRFIPMSSVLYDRSEVVHHTIETTQQPKAVGPGVSFGVPTFAQG